MRRIILVALAVAATASVAPGSAGAQTSPTLTLQEACQTFDGTPSVGLAITVSGVPPFSTVSGSVDFPDGGTISGSIFADENGVATITFFSGPGLYTVEITFPFSTVQSLEVDCLPNSKDECKEGGWRTFGVFKNQGDCVSFVATGGKNPPAGSP
jgi:hypothetical protein